MWMFLASLALAAIQGDSEAWLDRLGAADPADREAAVRWLVEYGEAVRSRLEALAAGPDPEVAARARTVLAELDARRELRRAADPFPAVTLEARDVPVADVLAAIREQAGFPLRRVGVPADRRVTVSFRDTPVLRAIVETCRQAQDVTFGSSWSSLVIGAGTARAIALSDDGLLAVAFTGANRSRQGLRSEVADTSMLCFVVVWGTRVAPASVRLVLDEAASSAGSLRETEDPRMNRGWPVFNVEPPVRTEWVELEAPLATDTEWITAGGAAIVRWALETERAEFPWQGAVTGVTLRTGSGIGARVERDPERSGHVRVEFDDPVARGEAGEVRVYALDASGRRHGGWDSGSMGDERATSGLWYSFDSVVPERIVVEVPTRIREVRVPFRFERVPLHAPR